MCKEKEGKQIWRGEMGVFIEWCESLCNDRSLMKCSFGLRFRVWWACGSFRDRGGIPELIPRYTANRRGPREGGGGPTSNESSPRLQTFLIFISPVFGGDDTWKRTKKSKISQIQKVLHGRRKKVTQCVAILDKILRKQVIFFDHWIGTCFSTTALGFELWEINDPTLTDSAEEQWHEEESPEWWQGLLDQWNL